MAANRAGQAPADLSLVVDEVLFRGNEVGLWAELNPANMAGTDALIDGYVKLNDAGNAYAVGALAFYTIFVTNTDYAADAPASWAELWEPQWDGKLGIVTTPNSGLLEVTAKTFFGGYESLESGELNAGLYYHDVVMLSIWDGLPIASTFPTEGGIVSDAYWVVPAASENISAAEKFLDYMSRPEVQTQMALTMGVAPIVPRDALQLSDEDFAAVSSDIEPIRVQTHIHLREGD